MNDAANAASPVTPVACARCRHVVREGMRDWACTRNPPQAFVFLTQPVVGTDPGQMHLSVFPRVQPQWRCGEFKARLEGTV